MDDMDRAERVLKFISLLKHSKAPWAGLPFQLMPWQEDFIRTLYGTLKPDGTRQYRQALLYLPAKTVKVPWQQLWLCIICWLMVSLARSLPGRREPGAGQYML